jgi:hypothetical protein
MIITLLDIFVCLLFVMFFVVVVVSNTRTQTRHRHMVLEIHILNDIVLSCKPHYIDFDKRIKYVLLFSLFVYNCIVDRDPIIREGGFGPHTINPFGKSICYVHAWGRQNNVAGFNQLQK